MSRSPKKTPLRGALREDSALQDSVQDGLQALKKAHVALIDGSVHQDLADSLDLDAAMKVQHPQANRWDYLIGHGPSGKVAAVEPHTAKQVEISTIIAKRTSAKAQLRGHLRDGVTVAKWLWVASGDVHFPDTDKAKKRLDQEGIEFVGKRVQAKHMPK